MSDDIFGWWSLPWGAPESRLSLEAGRLRQLGIDIPVEIPDITIVQIELTIPQLRYKKVPDAVPAPDPTLTLSDIAKILKEIVDLMKDTLPRPVETSVTPTHAHVGAAADDHPGLASADHPAVPSPP